MDGPTDDPRVARPRYAPQGIRRRIWREVEPWLCALCVYAGVLGTTLLPPTLLFLVYPLPIVTFALSPAAAVPLAIVVFDVRAFRRWRGASGSSVGVRMLRAASDGVQWWQSWQQRNHKL